MDREGVPTEQVMSTESITVTSGTTIEDAAETMRENNIGSLLVVDDDEQLAGVITSNDFLQAISNSDSEAEGSVGDYMTEDVITIDPEDSIQTAAARMITNGISHLPVEAGEEGVIGMVSTTDITAYSVSRT